MMVSYNSYFSRKVVLMSAFLTVLIVVLHSETPLRYGEELSWEAHPFIWFVFDFTRLAVPMFFFVSGMLFYRRCEWRDIPQKLRRRVFSLVVPFLVWNVLITGFHVLLDYIPAIAARMNGDSGIHSFGDFVVAVIMTRHTPLWFISFLIIYNLMSPAVMLVIRNKWVGVCAALGLFVASVVCGWDYFSLLHWLPVYLMGAVAGRHLYSDARYEDQPVLRWQSDKWMGVTLVVVFLTGFVLFLTSGDRQIYYEFMGPLTVWFLADVFGEPLIRGTEIRKWMTRTFIIFALHHLVINCIEGSVRAFLPHTDVVMSVTFVVTPIVTIALIAWLAGWLSRYPFYKYMSGGRG